MIEAVDGLVAGLYPRHFGPAGLDARTIDAFVSRTLDEALRTLEAQIGLELSLATEGLRVAAFPRAIRADGRRIRRVPADRASSGGFRPACGL